MSLPEWDKGSRPDALFCDWRAVMPEPQQKRNLFVDDDVLMNLYRRLDDAEEEDRIAFRFVVALILMRKKLLRYEGTEKRDGREWWIMSAKKPDADERERLPVLDPHLDEAGVGRVTEQLSEILEAEL